VIPLQIQIWWIPLCTEVDWILDVLVNTRPDIFFAVNTLSQFMVEPRHFHWVATKHVLRYLHGTVGYGLRYVSGGEVSCRDILILTGKGVQWTERAPQGVSSA
jgi:hypothetical protein